VLAGVPAEAADYTQAANKSVNPHQFFLG
jgi:hypothetical protein